MDCYHCLSEAPNTKLPAAGVCKVCQVGSCASRHGEICSICSYFHCNHHQSFHQRSVHGIKSIKELSPDNLPFPRTTRYSMKLCYDYLTEKNVDEPLLAINHGIELAEKFYDEKMKSEFEILKNNIIEKRNSTSLFDNELRSISSNIPSSVKKLSSTLLKRLLDNAADIKLDPKKM